LLMQIILGACFLVAIAKCFNVHFFRQCWYNLYTFTSQYGTKDMLDATTVPVYKNLSIL